MMLIRRAIVVLAILSTRAALAQTPGAGGASGTGGAPAAQGGLPPAAVPAPSGAPAPTPAAAPTPVAGPGPTPATSGAPVAAPAPPIPTAGTELTAEPVKPAGGTVVGGGAGLSPNLPQVGAGTSMSAKQAEEMTPSTGSAANDWKFEFHGYFRAPLRASWGPPTPLDQPSIYMDPATGGLPPHGIQPYAPGAPPPSGTQLHGTPRVPGYSYGTWEYTNTIGGPWSQLNFSYGNSRLTGTVIVDAYNQTDGGYRNLQAQQGIDQVFLTVNVPEAFGDLGGLVWNIGSFANRYGVAGKYDAGMYETYLFGRTHVAGSTWTANLSNLDAAGNWSLILEGGIGQKLDVVPFLNNQNYQVFMNNVGGMIGGNAGSPFLSDRSPDYLPWAGSVPIGSTYLHHWHAVAKFRSLVSIGLHYLFTWTPDDHWSPMNSMQTDRSNGMAQAITPRSQGPIQGSMGIWGGEVKLSGGVLGDGYLGYSHIDARNINALADSLEVVHSYGGPQFKQNFFGRTYNGHTGVYSGPQNETGTVDNISFQYAFSLGQYARYPEDFWGDGTDLVLTAFGLLSIVDSKPPPIALALAPNVAALGPAANLSHDWDMSTKKLKFGGDVIYTPLSWVGFGARFDAVKPDLDAAYSRTPPPANNPRVPYGNPGGSDLTFYELAARVVFKTEFVTHETITLLYAHYFLGRAAYPTFPYEWVAKSDDNAVSLAATLWW
jgi:hypothetical protein